MQLLPLFLLLFFFFLFSLVPFTDGIPCGNEQDTRGKIQVCGGDKRPEKEPEAKRDTSTESG